MYPYPEPIFLADPGHRKKTLKGHMYRLREKRKAETKGITDVDILRISTNFAYMMNSLPTLDRSKWRSAARAVVEHHFGNHTFYGDFCCRKDETEEQRKTSNKFYRDKQIDRELYEWLTELLDGYTTEDKLEEVGHGMETNINESLNSVVAWIAPKSKSFSGTVSLETRIYMAIGIHLVGFEQFFLSLLESMGIDVTPGVEYYLRIQQQRRENKSRRSKKPDIKIQRRKKQYKQLREATE